jgi:uncharacterized repeat protein (TIGR01451 family)
MKQKLNFKKLNMEGGEFMKKLILVVSILSVIAFVGQINAQTSAGQVIPNIAIVSANNMSAPAQDSTNVTVKRIQGVWYDGALGIAGDANGSAGNVTLLSFTIMNRGNSNDTFSLKITNTQTNAAFGSHPSWSNIIVGPSGFGPAINSTGSLAPGGTFNFQIRVRPVGTAPDGDYKEWQVLVRSTVITVAVATNYIGDNAVAYGGDIGENWAGVKTVPNFNAALTHGTGSTSGGAVANAWVQVMIQGPVLLITKRITAISSPNGTALVPGSTITYSIKVTNAGTAAALNPRIYDAVPLNTTYVAASASAGGIFDTIVAPGAYVRWTASGGQMNAGTVDTVTFRVRIN